MLTIQVQVQTFVLAFMLTWLCQAQQSRQPNECDRGVKRHHPSQANVFQVFTRQDMRKQWLDYACPEYTIFDPRECTCVESLRQEPSRGQRPVTVDNRRRQRQLRQDSQKQVRGGEVDDGQSHIKEYHPSPSPSGLQQFRIDQTLEHASHSARQDAGGVQAKKKAGDSIWQADRGDRERPESDCHLHRPSPDPSHFERWSDGQWVQEDCNWPFYTGLVWNQGACRCEWGPNRTVAMPMTGDSVPASCLMMLKLTFDGGNIKDEGRHIWLNVRNKENAAVETDPTAVGGHSGSFRGASIAIPYFKSNVLGDIFHIGFMFKLCPGDPDTDIALLHNDCIESEDGPGIVVTYQAWKKQITLSMRTVNSNVLVAEYCSLKHPQNQWTKIDIRYGSGYLQVQANGEGCVDSNKYYGPVATNNCPLTLLGEAFCGSIDEVIITRGCTESHAVS